MSKFIGKYNDIYGNVVYITNFNDNSIESSTDVKKAILLTNEDKAVVKKTFKKEHGYPASFEFIKLEKFNSIHDTTYNILREYEQDYYAIENISKLIAHKDNMSLECIDYAKNHIDNVNTFEEFGNKVADILIEKYNLKKKEQHS